MGLIAAEGFYGSGEKRRKYFSLVKNLTLAHVLLLVLAFFYKPGVVSRSTFILSWLLSISLTCIGRFCLDIGLKHFRQQGAACSKTFLICRPTDQKKAVRLLEKENCYKLVGWTDIGSLTVDRQSFDAILEKICTLGVAIVFICYLDCIESRMFLYWKLRNAGITMQILPIGLETFGQKAEIRMVGGLPSIQFSPPLITGSDFLLKRCFDFCCAASLMLLTMPLYLCIALLIKLDSPGAVFYNQTRIGLYGRPFKVWKFRTMVANADQLQKDLEASNEMKDGVLFNNEKRPSHYSRRQVSPPL